MSQFNPIPIPGNIFAGAVVVVSHYTINNDYDSTAVALLLHTNAPCYSVVMMDLTTDEPTVTPVDRWYSFNNAVDAYNLQRHNEEWI